jgi:hypothetical protein
LSSVELLVNFLKKKKKEKEEKKRRKNKRGEGKIL